MLAMVTNSTSNGLPTSTSYSSVVPPAWLWQSMKPGTIVMPFASKVCVPLRASARMSALLPTATNLPPLIENASARGDAGPSYTPSR